jgi:GNAT superfamily N-acetyltransferase
MEYNLRLAEKSDDEEIMNIGLEFAEQTFAKDAGRTAIELMFDRCKRDGLIFVAEKDGKICGVCGGFFADVVLAGGIVFHEVAWYVRPKHRGCGMMLFDALEKAARDGGAVAVIMVAYANDSQRVVEIAYRRRGYKDLEHHWIRRF